MNSQAVSAEYFSEHVKTRFLFPLVYPFSSFSLDFFRMPQHLCLGVMETHPHQTAFRRL